MSTANFGEGAVFEISDKMITDMVSFDQHLERIQKSAAKINPQPFKALVDAVNGLKVDNVQSLERLAAAMDKLSNATGAAQGINNVAQGTQNLGNSANSTNTSLSQTAQLLNQISVSRPFQNLSIGEVKSQIAEINKILNSQGKTYIDANGNQQQIANLDKATQQRLVNQRNALQQELKIQQASDEAKIASMKKVMDAQNADILLSEKKIAQARREYAETAKLKQQQNYKQNTTVQGALNFSSTANTLQRQITAIEYLKKARLSLNTTDADYKKKLDEINSAINRHNQALQQAGVQSANLANRHRDLMDISGQLARQFALLFSVSQVEGYISQIAKVRGEFELQQRSLEAILQNKTEADQIFQKTVDLAIKSPFQIKELVSYTKQLAAYRIEGDKLYDTTKRLADVSAGLGVDMQRLILAYGQVKAAAYLRGTEVRQFTEAGVNMYGELQSYFQEVKGEAYTTAQIVDMISKRKVTFEDVEAVFERLTSQGGLFYNMQEIQSETLNGKIANLKDSFDVMFNSIGKANEGVLKGTIDGVRTLVDNWESVASAGEALVAVFAAVKIQAALSSEKLLAMAIDMGVLTNTIPKQLTLWQALRTAFAFLVKGIASVSKALVSLVAKNPYIAALAALAYALYEIYDASTKTDEALLENKKTYEENMRTINALTAQYIQLAKAKKDAADAQANDQPVSFDENKNRADREKVVREMAGQLEKLNYNVNLDGIGSMTDEQLAKQADTLAKKYQEVQKAIKGMADAYDEGATEIEGWFGIFGDNIATDAKDLKSVEDEVTSNATAMGTQLDFLGAHYNELSDKAKEYYDAVKGGQNINEGESELEYLERVHEAISGIIKEDWGSKVANELQNSAIQMDVDWGDFHSAKDEFLHEVDKMKAEFEKKGITDPWMIATAIDQIAAENEWSQYETNIAKREFKVPLIFDQQKIDGQLSSIGEQLDTFFKGKSYTISIDWTGRDVPGGAGEYEKTGQGYLSELKAVNQQIKRYRAVTAQGGEWKGLDILTLNQQQTDLTQKLRAAGFGQELSDMLNKGNKKTSNAVKHERDILSERISTLREMNDRYEKLSKYESNSVAAQDVLESYAENLKYVKMPQSITDSFIPTKEGLKAALEKLLPTIKDFKKKSSLQKDIAELEITINQEKLQKELENVKEAVDKLFTGLDLHQKLKDAGLSESEVQALFPGLAKTLGDVEKGIYNKYTPLRDSDGKLGKDEQKQYDEELKQLNEKRIKEQQDLVVELTKAYKTQLSDQLQLDMWYYQERAKIAKSNLTPEMQTEYNNNLDKQYQQKTSENTWKEFQKGDFYIGLFENLDNASSRVINAMRDKLNSLRENLKGLPADQLKAIINQIEKLDELSAQKDPFKAITVSLKDYIKFLGKRKQLEKDYLTANKNIDSLTQEKDAQSKIVAQIQSQYDAEVEKNGESSEQAVLLKAQLAQEKALLDTILKRLEAEGKISKEKADQIRNGQKAEKTTTDSLHEIGSYFTGAADIINGGVEALNDWGLNIELSDEMTEVVDGFSKIGNSLNSIDLTKPMTIITGTIGVVGGIGKTLGGIFGWGTKDKKLQKQIEKHQEKIESLSKAYDKLKEHMDAAWDLSNLKSYYNQTVDNLEAQIVSYQAMIKAEEDKKKTDKDKIKEWKQDIADLEDQIAELKENYTESLGGFGSEENYQSAAQAFADAWVDAFNEGEDTLEALNDTFNDYFDNLLKKQLMLRASTKYIQPILDAFDAAVAEDSDSGEKVTKKELERIQALKDKNLEAYNEYASALMDILGVTPENSTELSALEQGIEGVTESTAEALEALLNSMRFFLATQQGDVAIIRQILEAQYGSVTTTTVQTSQTQTTEVSSSNPMLVELKTQTGYLQKLADSFEGCFTYNNTSNGKGLRVYCKGL